MRPLSYLSPLVLLTLLSCSGGSKAPPGKVCLMNSECASPLICTFGKCHAACAEARDCPTGQLCVKSAAGAVCQLPAESACLTGAGCQAPLVCAADRQCRSDCSADNACPTPTQKCVMPDRICAEPDELDPASGLLKNSQPVAGQDAGAGDAAASPDASAPADSAPAGSCADKTRNGTETDVDCGGTCGPCPIGKSCQAPGDCASASCIGGKCLECMPGATKCEGKKQATCIGGLWVTANNDCEQGCDATTGACRVCPASTCRSVKVIFHGAVDGNPDVQLAVDDGKVYRTSSDTDPLIGMKTALYGNFTEDRKQYTTDNTACALPDYTKRQNVYYLAPLDGLTVASSWYGGADAFKTDRYCQACPNFGCDNHISTPKRIEKIEVLAASGDLTCKVCLYRAGVPSDATLIGCASPNTALMGPDLDPAKAPAVLQLDDGKRCGSY